MGDLHSIAYSSLHNSSSLGGSGGGGYGFLNTNNHHLGVFNADLSQYFLELESSIDLSSNSNSSSSTSTPPFLSQFESDFSTGYLQDALFEFSSKRRRLEFCSDDDDRKEDDFNNTTRNCRSSACSTMSYLDDYDYNMMSSLMTKSSDTNTSVELGGSIEEDGSLLSEMKTTTTTTKEEAISSAETNSSSSSFHKSDSDKENLRSIAVKEKSTKKRTINNNNKVVYPFALVKPGGIEGDVTLNDINQRILMPPNRPVRHPVGDFACRPLISSADGPGLSGKAVVALTRIHTRGRGTITIVRTRG